MDSDQIRRHTTTVLLANGASMVFGLLSTAAVAHYFGSGETVDAFFIAQSVPALLGQILLSVGLLVIVPLYAQLRTQAGVAEVQRSMAPLFYVTGIALLACTAVIAAAAPLLVDILAPGFTEPAAALASQLMRWTSPMIPLLGLAGLLQGFENANHRFVRPAWSKPLPTALALAAMVVAAQQLGVKSYIWGSLLGATLGLAWQFLEVWSDGGFFPRLAGLREALGKLKGGVATVFTARLLGQAGAMITGMVATTLGAGAVSSLGYAFRIVSVPFLAASSFGLVVFPALAQAVAEDHREREARLYWRSIRVMALLGTVSSVGLFLWAGPLIQLLFERGAFTAADTAASASALRIYALGTAFVAANTCIGNAFWARRLYGVRLRMEIVALLLLISLSVLLARIWGVSGLAAALVVEYTFLTVIGLLDIQRRSPSPDFGTQVWAMLRLLLLGVAVTAVLWPFIPGLSDFRPLSLVSRGLTLAAGLVFSAAALGAAGFLLAVPEIDEIIGRALGRYSARGRALDPEQQRMLPRRVRLKLKRVLLRALPRRPRTTGPAQLKTLVSSEAAQLMVQNFRNGPRPPGLYAGRACDLSAADLEQAVDRALRREVDLLGSGPVDLGRPIQWHRDVVSGHEWPMVHHSRIVAVDLKLGIDCKFPWEVARCQHWTQLASARHKRSLTIPEMLSQFREFVVANPPGWGINYGNAMEVALRSVSWICSFRAVSDLLSDDDLAHLAMEMRAAGRFISSNLEDIGPGLNTNHYIADLVGLYVISAHFPTLPDAPEWFRFSGDELTAELTRQFEVDGTHGEGSPYYARLVLEFYLFTFLLGRRLADARVEGWRPRLEKAFDFLATAILPDGTLPRIGDDDAGRLLAPPGEPVMDVRYLLQVGAVVFRRPDWKESGGTTPRPGLEYWLGTEGVEQYRQLTSLTNPAGARVFETAGIAVIRDKGVVLVVQGGSQRAVSPRGHLHNDLTSFEYCADGVRWILDPGSYQYTRQPLWRNRFRSTSAHNVVRVNGKEQNSIKSDWLFYLSRDVQPQPLVARGGEITAAYHKLGGDTLVVSRRLQLCTACRMVSVTDSVHGEGEHSLALGMNVAQAPFTYVDTNLVHFQLDQAQLLAFFDLPYGFAVTVGDDWHSPRFGIRERCLRLETVGTVRLPFEFRWGLAAIPGGERIGDWQTQLADLVRPDNSQGVHQPELATEV